MISAKRSPFTILIAAIALCAPGLPCLASVEPELTTAIRHRDAQRVSTLLSEGVDVNETDEGPGQTPLMWAVRAGSVPMVQALLNHGAAVNRADMFGNTAVSLAVKNGNSRIVQMLRARGARAVAAGSAPVRKARIALKHARGSEVAASAARR